MTLYTVGHSTRTLDEFLTLLKEYRTEALADIRSFPASARHPHFNKESLERTLPAAGIEYRWFGKELGGYRKNKDPNSPHTALHSAGFRNYADHMATQEFVAGVEKLKELAATKNMAYMCAEKLWWRCHRSLVSDYLVGCLGVGVIHLIESGRTEPHRLHRAARLLDGRLIYNVEGQARLL